MADSYSSSSGSKRFHGARGYDIGHNREDVDDSFHRDSKRWRVGMDDAGGGDSRGSAGDYYDRHHRSEDYSYSHRRDGWHDRNDRYSDRKQSEANYYGPQHGEGSYSLRHQDREDWKCWECKTWNYYGEYRCARCGFRKERSPTSRSDDYRGDGSSHDSRAEKVPVGGREVRNGNGPEDGVDGGNNEDVDEFGRPHRPKEEPRPFKVKREWPPSFDEDGSAFVFDSRCAMFYESESDFFYDPKSKLYYGNKQATYYQYNAESKSFEPVAGKSDITGQVSSTDPEPILNKISSGSAGDSAGKKTIAIKIKTKVLKKNDKSDAAKQTVNEVDEPVRKQHAIDIEKWTARTQELKASEAAPASSKSSATATDAPAPGGLVSSGDAVPKTPKGEPICLLCRRKFPTLEKLNYHVDVSQLHKDNLAKQAAQTQAPPVVSNPTSTTLDKPSEAAPSAEYVDRAQQRRNLYGPELSAVPVVATSSVPSTTDATTMTQVTVPPTTDATTMTPTTESSTLLSALLPQQHDPLGAGNVGHQMLKKLGWTGGVALPGGKGPQSEAEQRRQEQMHSNLQREWDRSSGPRR